MNILHRTRDIDLNLIVMAILSAGVLAGCQYCQPLLLVSVGYQAIRILLGDGTQVEQVSH